MQLGQLSKGSELAVCLPHGHGLARRRGCPSGPPARDPASLHRFPSRVPRPTSGALPWQTHRHSVSGLVCASRLELRMLIMEMQLRQHSIFGWLTRMLDEATLVSGRHTRIHWNRSGHAISELMLSATSGAHPIPCVAGLLSWGHAVEAARGRCNPARALGGAYGISGARHASVSLRLPATFGTNFPSPLH